jgi:hypothetical protein
LVGGLDIGGTAMVGEGGDKAYEGGNGPNLTINQRMLPPAPRVDADISLLVERKNSVLTRSSCPSPGPKATIARRQPFFTSTDPA